MNTYCFKVMYYDEDGLFLDKEYYKIIADNREDAGDKLDLLVETMCKEYGYDEEWVETELYDVC